MVFCHQQSKRLLGTAARQCSKGIFPKSNIRSISVVVDHVEVVIQNTKKKLLTSKFFGKIHNLIPTLIFNTPVTLDLSELLAQLCIGKACACPFMNLHVHVNMPD